MSSSQPPNNNPRSRPHPPAELSPSLGRFTTRRSEREKKYGSFTNVISIEDTLPISFHLSLNWTRSFSFDSMIRHCESCCRLVKHRETKLGRMFYQGTSQYMRADVYTRSCSLKLPLWNNLAVLILTDYCLHWSCCQIQSEHFIPLLFMPDLFCFHNEQILPLHKEDKDVRGDR